MGEEPVRKPPTVSGGPPRKPWLPRKFFDRLEAEHEARGTCSATATSRPAARGFTLVEMLVVIAIITILAGLVLAGVTAARRHAKEKAAESTIKRIELAATRYETDFGDYPDSGGMDGVAGCENLLEALKSTAKSGPYIEGNEFRETDSNRNGRPEIADEWGRPFRYVHHKYYKVAPNKRTYRLFSVGADGKEDTDDDIRNWDPRKPE
ncbi:MAG: type II secretion system protein GspG [Planctomycetota bacterium]|nr:type II secretion system protein GspG [Planctomycetota bacterium]